MIRAIFLSVLLHVLIIVTLVLQFQINKVSTGSNVTLKAYVYRKPFLIAPRRKFSGNLSSAHQTREKIFDRGDLVAKSQRLIKSSNQRSLAQKQLAGKHDALLIILHNLIQKRVAYFGDLSLAAGHRIAEVAFDLLPNGEVEQVEIQRSSGLKFFDNLAKQAVKEIQPVTAAGHFLHNKKHFVVAVEFT